MKEEHDKGEARGVVNKVGCSQKKISNDRQELKHEKMEGRERRKKG